MNDESRTSGASVMSYAGSEGVIKMRLDTSRHLIDMELFLKGLKLVPMINPETQQTELNTQQIGEPLMNDKGIQCFLMTLSQTVSSHGVQGNWKPAYFEQFICEADKNFSSDLWLNVNEWDVSLKNYNLICNAFMNLLQEFASRIIENKERESYGMSMRTNETVVQNQGRTGFLGIGG
jgi:hypothetical protein